MIKTPTTQETECSSTLTHVSSCWTLASKGLAQELQEVICPNVQTTNIISISVSSTWTTLKSQRTRKQPGCCCCCSPGSTVEQHDKLFINHVRQPLDKIKVVAQTMCVNPWTERSRYMMRPPTRPRLCCLIGIKIDQHERELKNRRNAWTTTTAASCFSFLRRGCTSFSIRRMSLVSCPPCSPS